MRFAEQDVRAAAVAAALTEDQIGALLEALRRTQPIRAGAARFDLAHLLWYAGALIVIGAMGLFTTVAFNQMGGVALTGTALVYAVLFTSAGHHLWRRRDLRTPGGLLVAVAVAMAPMAVYGIQEMAGFWEYAGPHHQYRDVYIWIKGSWVLMEIATILAGIVALLFYPFPFIVAVIAAAAWLLSMDLAPWLTGSEILTFETRRKVSFWFGLSVLAIAWTIDLKRRRDTDFAFWLHLAGLAAFWGGLSLSENSPEWAKALYCAINIGLVLLSVFLGRRAYAVYGAVGISIYLGHLAKRVFQDSLLFPFALSLIGVAIIALGLYLQRMRPALSAWMNGKLPIALKRLRPLHAVTPV